MSQKDNRNGSAKRLVRLLREAGPRPEIPAADLDHIRVAARSEWRDLVARHRAERPPRRGRTAARYLALAAVLALAVGVGWGLWSRSALRDSAVVARVTLATGRVEARPPRPDGELEALSAGSELLVGAEVETVAAAEDGPSRSTLELAGGPSVRLDRGTRLKLLSNRRLRLERGAVYVESEPFGRPTVSGGEPAASGAVEILTDHGTVVDVGTRFEVRVEPGRDSVLHVRVRDGSVLLRRNGRAVGLKGGEQVDLHVDGRIERTAVASADPGWAWAVEAAPAIRIEGRLLHEYLEWFSWETGLEVRYARPGLAASASEIRLFGSIEGMTPVESLDVVLPGSGLSFTLDERELVLSEPGPGQNS